MHAVGAVDRDAKGERSKGIVFSKGKRENGPLEKKSCKNRKNKQTEKKRVGPVEFKNQRFAKKRTGLGSQSEM